MKSKISIIASLLVLASCAATTRGVAPDLEITNTKKGKAIGGIVVYNPHGLKQLVSMRRNKAISRIRTACHPYPFRIKNEETAKPSAYSDKYKGTNVHLLTGRTIRFVNFNCVKP